MVAIALTGDEIELVLDGDEPTIIAQLDDVLAGLPAGVLVTWNGAGFDLPYLQDRARRHGLSLGLELRLDPAIGGRHEPLLGHDGAYRARWYHHRHVDGYQLFRADVGATLHLPCGLKPLARMVGLPVVEVDRERIHELTDRPTACLCRERRTPRSGPRRPAHPLGGRHRSAVERFVAGHAVMRRVEIDLRFGYTRELPVAPADLDMTLDHAVVAACDRPGRPAT